MSTSVKKRWNWSLWIGFLFALAGFFSYAFFVQFPITSEFPWVNFLLFAVGGILLALGLFRAFGRPQIYRGKIFGPILALFGISMFGLFSYIFFYELRQVPPSTGAPRVGQKAPDFFLMDQNGKPVGLGDLLSNSKGAVLIFYRGFW
jgi:drug/metabolite transporter (DMT)-like permease